MISYSQNFEDVLLARLFQGQANGFYIDVGAWDPTRHSVTRHFYDLGWTGINIEPVPHQFQMFVEERTRDQNLNVAVADFAGQACFYECKELTSLSTANETQAEQLRRAGYEVIPYEVPVVTLEKVIAGCGDRTIDFLKIDVEGFEAAVLRGVDLRTRRPRVLVIEATLPSVKIEDWDQVDSIRNWDDWEPALLAADYRLAWYDGLSRFYLRKEDAVLRKRLCLPPCVHDGFELAEVHEVKRAQQVLMKEREDVLNTNRRLVGELRAVESDRTEKARVLERIERELAELQTNQRVLTKEREDVLEVNERLARDLRAVDEDRAAKVVNLEALAAEVSELGRSRQQLLDEREAILIVNRSVEGQLRSVEADQANKTDVIARLARQVTEMASERQALTEEREKFLDTNTRLQSELRAVGADQIEKEAIIERLIGEVAELKADRRALLEARANVLKATQRLETELGSVKADCAEKSQAIERLNADLERASLENTIQSHKLLAKDQVIELASIRNLNAKAVLRGFADLRARRRHTVPAYGDYIPAETTGIRLHVAIDTLEIVFGVSGGVETYMKMLTSALLSIGVQI
ncbi:FkbM family methyltransferase [Bradyrhizobium sp. 173]|uniref:FkbM family methyltransferase n=1 Tax=Bradyrhizobium sp. 173 TaxID=2782644 RepID=UPI001FFA0F8F|nr:FkbM family methyltransferase [Bradyrhizobium sp. 173]MCK1565594.1 FkbM family methyltransferase [Bradyrhizobium sp. 173]